MKKLLLIFASAVMAWGQSSSATIQFAGTNVSAILTVNAAGFTPEIQGIEITQQVGACNGTVLQAQITSGSASIPLTVPAGCTITPGMGIAIGCAAGGGSCTSVSTVKAAGCTGSAPVSCPVVQGQLGTTPGTYAAGSAVTILKGGDGNNWLCNAVILPVLQSLAQLGAATVNTAPVPATASTAVATQNTAIATAVSANALTIAGAFSCTPGQ
jgi:hypothetical protein